MNEKDELRLQRLIDGEMGDWERRVFLAGLEEEPEGWRRVAVAFLEDQALRGALEPDVGSAMPAPSLFVPGRHRFGPLALAASLLLTLGLGLALGRMWGPTPPRVETGLVRLRTQGAGTGEGHPATSGMPSGTQGESAFLPGGTFAYELTIERKGNTFEVRTVPVWEPGNGGPSPQRGSQEEVPEPLRSALAGSGYRLEQGTQYWPVQSEEGRPILVPVHTVAVAPHGQ